MTEINKDQVSKNPVIIKKLDDIVFLRSKLDYLRDEIHRDYDKFIHRISDYILEKNKKHLENIDKDSSNEIRMSTFLHRISANDSLLYHFDSFLVDIRRLIEFCLRMTLLSLNFKDDSDFKVEKFMNHLCKESNDTNSKFELLLENKFNWFVTYLRNDSKWIFNLNGYRKNTIHYMILNNFGPCKIEYSWNSLQTLENKPNVEISKLKILGIDEDMKEFMKSYLFNIDFFIDQIQKLINEINAREF